MKSITVHFIQGDEPLQRALKHASGEHNISQSTVHRIPNLNSTNTLTRFRVLTCYRKRTTVQDSNSVDSSNIKSTIPQVFLMSWHFLMKQHSTSVVKSTSTNFHTWGRQKNLRKSRNMKETHQKSTPGAVTGSLASSTLLLKKQQSMVNVTSQCCRISIFLNYDDYIFQIAPSSSRTAIPATYFKCATFVERRFPRQVDQ